MMCSLLCTLTGSSKQKETQKRKHAKVKVDEDTGDQKPIGPYFLKTITRWSRNAVVSLLAFCYVTFHL